MIDELKPLYEKLKGDTQPIKDWVEKNPQEAVDLVQKYLNITKTELNQKKAGLKGRVKTKKPKKTRKKKTKKMKLKVKIGGADREEDPLLHPLLEIPVAIIGVVLFYLLQGGYYP